jgi:hypothetical protein
MHQIGASMHTQLEPCSNIQMHGHARRTISANNAQNPLSSGEIDIYALHCGAPINVAGIFACARILRMKG